MYIYANAMNLNIYMGHRTERVTSSLSHLQLDFSKQKTTKTSKRKKTRLSTINKE